MTITYENPARRLSGKIAVVTAAGQGIGRAVAERFLAEGATVYATDLREDLLATLTGAEVARLDATDADAVARYFAGIGRIDALVHAVGYVHQGTIEECTPEDWRRSTAITLDSAYYVLRAAIPAMKANGGSITTIASVASSIKGFPKRAAYGAAKGGLIGLTKAVAADYLANGIRCNAVCPGFIQTPHGRREVADLTALGVDVSEAAMKAAQGRFGLPEDIARAALYLASDDAEFVNGTELFVDNGFSAV